MVDPGKLQPQSEKLFPPSTQSDGKPVSDVASVSRFACYDQGGEGLDGRNRADGTAVKTFEKIMKHLADRGQTQRWLARRLGVDDKRISNWSKGIGEPTGSQLWRIAEEMGLSIEYLANPDATRPPDPPITAEQRQILDLVRALGLKLDTALQRIAFDPGESPYGSGYTRVIGQSTGLPMSLQQSKQAEKPTPKKPSVKKRKRRPNNSAR
jgi:transcriptional regulator with XRE-family HTH domain